ncbi:hypothetical protein [Erythrobacter crassostreae]|uniref:Uncharacterized protein n=1 Tax=Erythrobacter crassostreae TaxID=2828328 RepID=A0A9X1F2H2_9SPHN|nr:hypothetical protein [Erythrobacter crassostrea]MBV7259065.1 hypothetical protein [Erythrobacter crassostrea]
MEARVGLRVVGDAETSLIPFASVDFVNEGGLSICAEYRGRFASDYQSHSGGVRVRLEF